MRTKAVLAAVGGSLALAGVGLGVTAGQSGNPGTRPASDAVAVTTSSEAPASTPAASSTPVAATTEAPAPIATRAAAPKPTTVRSVTTPAAEPTDTSTASTADDSYVPPQETRPPGAPSGSIYVPLPPAPKMPGEPGYVETRTPVPPPAESPSAG